MIRRKKTTIFTDAKDNTTVGELKKMVEGEEFSESTPNYIRMNDKNYILIILNMCF